MRASMTKVKSWRWIEWKEFFAWTSGRKVRSTQDNVDDSSVRILYEDGAQAVIHSNYEGDYSDVTPGAGVQPPTVEVRDP